jgi:hypothetical protein
MQWTGSRSARCSGDVEVYGAVLNLNPGARILQQQGFSRCSGQDQEVQGRAPAADIYSSECFALYDDDLPEEVAAADADKYIACACDGMLLGGVEASMANSTDGHTCWRFLTRARIKLTATFLSKHVAQQLGVVLGLP